MITFIVDSSVDYLINRLVYKMEKKMWKKPRDSSIIL